MDTYKSGNIFRRKKSWVNKLRLPKRWRLLGGLVVLFLALFALSPLSSSATKVIKAQDYNPDHWWNRDNCNGSEAPYQCSQDATYPLPAVEPIDPIPTVAPDEPYQIPAGTSSGINPGGLQQINSAIIQNQQQIQTQMNSCVQRRQQIYNQLVEQNKQLDKLQTQYDALGTAISNSKTDAQRATLQAQQDRVQQNIDRLNDASMDTQVALDDLVADCQEKIGALQTNQDDLESRLSDQFNTLMNYELPN